MAKTKRVADPPDGGWGWLVVFASFMIHVIADGVAYTFGLFVSEISSNLGSSKSATAWIASIMAGVTYGAGPIASAFVNRFGCRTVSIAGTIIAAFGFAISYYATSVLFLYISVGLVGGLGLGLIYLPAIVSVTCYFEKKRSFATGIAVCGSGFGTMLLAPVIKILLVNLAWRGAFLVTGGIILNCLIFSVMFRPVDTIEVTEDEEEKLGASRDKKKSGVPDIIEPFEKVDDDSKGLPSVKYIYYPTDSPETENSVDGFASPEKKNPYPPLALLHVQEQTLTMSSSQPALPVGIGSMESLNRYSTLQSKKRHSLKMPFQSSGNFNTDGVDVRHRHNRPYHSSVTTSHGLILERKDVFYSGSLIKIPDFNTLQEEKSSLDSTDAPNLEDDPPVDFVVYKKIFGCIRCTPQFYNVLTTMLSTSLMKDPIFLLFAISNFLTSIGYNVPYVYLVDMAEENANPNKTESTEFLLSIVGIANTFSRIILGYLSDKKWVNRLYLYNSALVLCGMATGVAALTGSMDMLRVYSAAFGALMGVYVSLTSVILVDLLGLDKLTNAFGLLLLFQGIGTVIGPPIVGKLFDVTGDYRYGFALAGGMIAISGAILFVVPCIHRQQRNRRLKQDQHITSERLLQNEKAAQKILVNNNLNEDV
ncbi:unnamed protein product [Allacma fusca]|uniref:Major facilitator superfamily (MFS) profile domain-containing protein n=1 Tax=Allacma fusca TaxID=39272 RepID=A0A8J2LSD8_9HEXA|nr:unnamed protein product [Allacma fusca]